MASTIDTSKLLTGPSPPITRTLIDWPSTPLREYADAYAVILENVLTADECAALTATAEESAAPDGWVPATVDSLYGRGAVIDNYRKSDRIIWDEAGVMQRLYQRLLPWLPEVEKLEGRPGTVGARLVRSATAWKLERLNERMRFLRYGPGHFFRPHSDSSYETADGSERAFYTVHLYLNEGGPDNELKGGAKTFHSMDRKRQYRVEPKVGRVLIFQQSNLMHSGEEVSEGLKVTMRTELMYKRNDG